MAPDGNYVGGEEELKLAVKQFEDGIKDLDDQYGIFSQGSRLTKIETKRLVAITDAVASMLHKQVDALDLDSNQLVDVIKQQRLDFELWAEKLGWIYREDEGNDDKGEDCTNRIKD